MKGDVTDWLPSGAFDLDAVRGALAGTVAQWSSRWLLRSSAEITGVGMDANGQTAPYLQADGVVAAARMSGPGKRILLEEMLDADLARLQPGEADHHVMEELALQALTDLVGQVDDAFAAAGSGGGSRLAISVSVAGRETFQLLLPDHALVPMLKSRTGEMRATQRPLRNRLEALRTVSCRLEGVLGHAELRLAELNELGVGDVVLLDRMLNEAVELQLPDGQSIAAGRLGRSDGRVSIQL